MIRTIVGARNCANPVTVRSPEEYRAETRRIREQAQQVDREDLQVTILQIVELYESMAEQVKKMTKQQQVARRK
jgi:hypothetical protein